MNCIKIKKICGRIYREKIQSFYYKLSIGLYHLKRSLKYCSDSSTKNGWKASMRVKCHVLEKGLTMPNFRYGFGISRLLEIIRDLNLHKKYKDEDEYVYAIGLIKEYLKVHNDVNYQFSNDICKILNSLVEQYPEIKATEQIEITRDEYFKNINAPFPTFAKSRRSIRYFETPSPLRDIEEAIEIASSAPSACNRQAVKCHYYEGNIVKKILSVHNGNNGFGKNIPQLLVITFDTNMIGAKEYNDAFTNVGIFVMNLTYALYNKKIASIILNWSAVPHQDKKLRKILTIPKCETITVLIAIGNPPNHMKIAISNRQKRSELFIIH